MGRKLIVGTPIAQMPHFEHLILVTNSQEVQVGDADPTSAVLRSDGWYELGIAIASAGGVKVIRDVIVAYLGSKKSKLTLTDPESKISISFEGPITDVERVGDLVEKLAAPKPSERSIPPAASQ